MSLDQSVKNPGQGFNSAANNVPADVAVTRAANAHGVPSDATAVNGRVSVATAKHIR